MQPTTGDDVNSFALVNGNVTPGLGSQPQI